MKFEFSARKNKGDLDKDRSLSRAACGTSGAHAKVLRKVTLYSTILIQARITLKH